MDQTDFSGMCQCPCGAVKLCVTRPPMMRLYCHCTICQSVYRKPFADVTVVQAGDVEIEDQSKIQFDKHRSPPNVNRGICSACENPVVGFMMPVPGVRIAFVPTHMYTDPEDVSAATIHIFYDKRVDDIEDSLPKYSGYLSSEMAVTRLLTPKLFGR